MHPARCAALVACLACLPRPALADEPAPDAVADAPQSEAPRTPAEAAEEAPSAERPEPAPTKPAANAAPAPRPVRTSPPAPAKARKARLSYQAQAEMATYTDSDHVSVISPSGRVRVGDELAGWHVGGRYVVDVVSAASADVVANASPRWKETRHVVSIDGDYERNDFKSALAASASIEPDYRALQASYLPSLKIDDDHITLAAGYTFGHDTVGRAGTSYSDFHRTLLRHQLGAGASFVINPSTLLWLGGDLHLERGDQSKPYRYIPLFDAATAAAMPRGASAAQVNDSRLQERPLENLPRSRNRYALTARLAHRGSRATFRIEQRLYADSWSQLGSTTDLRYAWDLNRRLTLAPTLRFHLQRGASFWQRATVAELDASGSAIVPTVRAGDRELGPLWTVTVGGDTRYALTPRESRTPLAVTARLALIHTEFLDAIYLARRTGVFFALGFDAAID